MKFTGICLITKDVPGLAAFYSRVFGCPAAGDDEHAEISLPGLPLAIFCEAGMERMAPGSMEGAGRGSFTFGFEVADVDAEFERLKQLGVEVIKPPKTYPWGCRSLWFRDPDGNLIDWLTPVTPA